MKILAIENDHADASREDFQPYLHDEAFAVWILSQKNIIREIYFRADQSNAVLILECDSVDAAKIALSELPLVKHNLIEFQLIPLKPYPGFARLFGSKNEEK